MLCLGKPLAFCPSPSWALSLPEDVPRDAGGSEVPGWAAGGPANGPHGPSPLPWWPEECDLGRRERPGARRPPGALGPGPAAVPLPAAARCRPPVAGAALALPRSPFSLVLAIRPNLLRQEVQMSPNCFRSDAAFSSEAVVQAKQTPKIRFFYPFHLLSVSPPGNCGATPSRSLRFAAKKGTFFPFRSLPVN